MNNPPFTKVVWGKKQQSPSPKRVRMWLRRLHRAREIIDCPGSRFAWRWEPILSPDELTLALEHRQNLDLWLDAILIIHERIGYYKALVK